MFGLTNTTVERSDIVTELVMDITRGTAGLREKIGTYLAVSRVKFAAYLAARRERRAREKPESVPMTRVQAAQFFMAEHGWTPWTITPANQAWLNERLYDVAADPRP